MSDVLDNEYQIVYGKLCAAREMLYSSEQRIKSLANQVMEECFRIIGNPLDTKVEIDITSPEKHLVKIAMPNMSLSIQLSGYVVGVSDKMIVTLDDGSEFNALLLADVAFDDDKLLTKQIDRLLNDVLRESRNYHMLFHKLEIWNRLTEISNRKLPED